MTRVALMLDVLGDRRGSAGNVRHLVEISRELRELGHEPVLVGHDHDPEGELFDGIEVRAVNIGPVQLPHGRRAILERYWSGMRRTAALVPDDVAVVNPYDWPSLRAGRLAAQRLEVPMVWTRNDDTIWERGWIPNQTARGNTALAARLPRLGFGLLDLRDAHAAERVMVLSEHDAAMVRTAYHRSAEVLRIGPATSFFDDSIDRDAVRRRLGIGEEQFLVLAVALLMPHRRFEDLLAATAQLADDSVQTLIIGAGHILPDYAEQLQAAAAAIPRVTLRVESVSDQELRELYAAADVYVFPSSRQSYGQAPLEALAAGTPVIVSSGAGVSEALRGRGGVQIVPPGSPAAIAGAIGATREAGRAAAAPTRAWITATLTNASYAQRMASAYDEAISEARARRSSPRS